jgi:hypothetical protein
MRDISKEILESISFDITEFYENFTSLFHYRLKRAVQRLFYMKIWVRFCVYLGVYQTNRFEKNVVRKS